MEMVSQKRAIMFTDIVGYTALMGKDSAKALELIRISKEIQKPLVEKHNGKWLKEMGDGAMAQFSTALDAVNCSIEIQEIARGKLDAKLRIGIHLGDVTVEQDDVHGDGVNVASRLESIADPGGIYISESIEKAVRGQTDIQAKYLGEVKLKNIDYGVRTYALQGVGLPVPVVKDEKELSGHFFAELQRRGVLRAGVVYLSVALILILLLREGQNWLTVPDWSLQALLTILIVAFPIALYLAWNYERSPDGFVRTSSKESWQNPYKSSQKKPLTNNFIIAAMVLIIVLMYVYPRYFSSSGAGTEVTIDDKSIAVMPFDNESADEENQYFVNGMMEDIRNNLSKIADLRVISKTSTEKYRETNLLTKEIAEELGVNYLLEGTVQKQGNRVKIHAQLIEAESDNHIWTETYLRDVREVFKVQSEIAQIIAGELYAVITPEEQKIIETIPTTNLTAFDFFLRARDEHTNYWLDNSDKNALEKAITLYQRALENDSTYAQVYTGLAMAYWDKYYWEIFFEEDFLDSVLILANKALSFDNQFDEAYWVRGIYYWKAKSDNNKALSDLDKALKINPNYSWAYWVKGEIYSLNLDNYVEGIKNLHKAASLDHSLELPSILRVLSSVYHLIGFDDKFIYYEQEAFKLDGDSAKYFGYLSRIEFFKGNLETSLELSKTSYEYDSTDNRIIFTIIYLNNLLGNNQEAYNFAIKLIELAESEEVLNLADMQRIGYAFWQAGKQEEAKYYFDKQIRYCLESIRLNREYAVTKFVHIDLAGVYAFLGEKEKAYQYLEEVDEKSVHNRIFVHMLKHDPLLNSIRDEARFQNIQQNIEAKYQKEHERVRVWLEEENLRLSR